MYVKFVFDNRMPEDNNALYPENEELKEALTRQTTLLKANEIPLHEKECHPVGHCL